MLGMSRGPNAIPTMVPETIRVALDMLANSTSVAYGLVRRAQIIQFSAAGLGCMEIARRLGCSDRMVRTWRARFREDPRVEALSDRHRSGRPSTVALSSRVRLVQLACERPNEAVVPFRDAWTYAALGDALFAACGVRLSESEIGRILRNEKLRPHRIRQWLHSPDPKFAEKAERVCDLYLTPQAGVRVVSIDEKPLMVRAPKYPNHRAPDGCVRREYEYIRNGTGVLLAGLSVHDGEVFAQVTPNRTASTLVAFMEQLALRWPDERITVVWDNLNIHYDGADDRWTRFNQRHGGRFDFVYTPIHASWMNQVEVFFSIVERRVLRLGSFADLAAMRERLVGFIEHWNAHEARPFRWTWRPDKSDDRFHRAA